MVYAGRKKLNNNCWKQFSREYGRKGWLKEYFFKEKIEHVKCTFKKSYAMSWVNRLMLYVCQLKLENCKLNSIVYTPLV